MTAPKSSAPLFEVRKDGKAVMSTNDEVCIYDRRTRDSIRRAGYKCYMNGKVMREQKQEGIK